MNYGRDAETLSSAGYRGYPAFKWTPGEESSFEDSAIEPFLRRVPSPRRSDFAQYLAHYRLRPGPELTGITLLGATGASLPNDGFSLVDPLDPHVVKQDAFLEIHGARYYGDAVRQIVSGAYVRLVAEPSNIYDPFAVRVEAASGLIGYINRLQSKSVSCWIARRSVDARVSRVNGSSDRPRIFIIVTVGEQACEFA